MLTQRHVADPVALEHMDWENAPQVIEQEELGALQLVVIVGLGLELALGIGLEVELGIGLEVEVGVVATASGGLPVPL